MAYLFMWIAAESFVTILSESRRSDEITTKTIGLGPTSWFDIREFGMKSRRSHIYLNNFMSYFSH